MQKASQKALGICLQAVTFAILDEEKENKTAHIRARFFAKVIQTLAQ